MSSQSCKVKLLSEVYLNQLLALISYLEINECINNDSKQEFLTIAWIISEYFVIFIFFMLNNAC